MFFFGDVFSGVANKWGLFLHQKFSQMANVFKLLRITYTFSRKIKLELLFACFIWLSECLGNWHNISNLRNLQKVLPEDGAEVGCLKSFGLCFSVLKKRIAGW